MPCTLRYGQAATITLPLDPPDSAGDDSGNAATPLDVRQATLDALAAPLDYPALAQALVGGDHVTVAVDRLVPHVGEVVAAIVEHLVDCGVPTEAITVLFSEARAAAVPLVVRLPQHAAGGKPRGDVRIEVHDPDDRGKLSYLTNTASGKSIYLNRSLGEADLMIAVGSWRGAESWSYRGPYGGVYPTFSDRAAQARFRNPVLLHSADDTFRKSQDEIESIGWKSGVQFTVQVVPGEGDDVAAVVAGEITSVAKRVAMLHAVGHRREVADPVRTVIAALSGTAAQTWESFAIVLGAVLDRVEDGGVIAVCTELAEPPGPALELLSQCGDDRDAVLAHVRKERPIDLFVALQLAEAQRRVRIHLLSKLDPEVVENLGMQPIDDAADVGRLAARGGSCLVLGDAQHAVLVEQA
jgi:nickel-dependent lactate racemase